MSVNAAGTASGQSAASLCDLTPDGRYVLFTSASADMAGGSTNSTSEVYRSDLTAQTTVWVSAHAATLLPGSLKRSCQYPAMSANGRRVAYQIVDSQSLLCVWHDLDSGATHLVSSNALRRALADGTTLKWLYRPGHAAPRISADGRWVAYVGYSLGELGADNPTTVAFNQVYLWDATTGQSALVSVGADGSSAGFGSSDSPALSDDGQWAVFVSGATNLTARGGDGTAQIYLRDPLPGRHPTSERRSRCIRRRHGRFWQSRTERQRHRPGFRHLRLALGPGRAPALPGRLLLGPRLRRF